MSKENLAQMEKEEKKRKEERNKKLNSKYGSGFGGIFSKVIEGWEKFVSGLPRFAAKLAIVLGIVIIVVIALVTTLFTDSKEGCIGKDDLNQDGLTFDVNAFPTATTDIVKKSDYAHNKFSHIFSPKSSSFEKDGNPIIIDIKGSWIPWFNYDLEYKFEKQKLSTDNIGDIEEKQLKNNRIASTPDINVFCSLEKVKVDGQKFGMSTGENKYYFLKNYYYDYKYNFDNPTGDKTKYTEVFTELPPSLQTPCWLVGGAGLYLGFFGLSDNRKPNYYHHLYANYEMCPESVFLSDVSNNSYAQLRNMNPDWQVATKSNGTEYTLSDFIRENFSVEYFVQRDNIYNKCSEYKKPQLPTSTSPEVKEANRKKIELECIEKECKNNSSGTNAIILYQGYMSKIKNNEEDINACIGKQNIITNDVLYTVIYKGGKVQNLMTTLKDYERCGELWEENITTKVVNVDIQQKEFDAYKNNFCNSISNKNDCILTLDSIYNCTKEPTSPLCTKYYNNTIPNKYDSIEAYGDVKKIYCNIENIIKTNDPSIAKISSINEDRSIFTNKAVKQCKNTFGYLLDVNLFSFKPELILVKDPNKTEENNLILKYNFGYFQSILNYNANEFINFIKSSTDDPDWRKNFFSTYFSVLEGYEKHKNSDGFTVRQQFMAGDYTNLNNENIANEIITFIIEKLNAEQKYSVVKSVINSQKQLNLDNIAKADYCGSIGDTNDTEKSKKKICQNFCINNNIAKKRAILEYYSNCKADGTSDTECYNRFLTKLNENIDSTDQRLNNEEITAATSYFLVLKEQNINNYWLLEDVCQDFVKCDSIANGKVDIFYPNPENDRKKLCIMNILNEKNEIYECSISPTKKTEINSCINKKTGEAIDDIDKCILAWEADDNINKPFDITNTQDNFLRSDDNGFILYERERHEDALIRKGVRNVADIVAKSMSVFHQACYSIDSQQKVVNKTVFRFIEDDTNKIYKDYKIQSKYLEGEKARFMIFDKYYFDNQGSYNITLQSGFSTGNSGGKISELVREFEEYLLGKSYPGLPEDREDSLINRIFKRIIDTSIRIFAKVMLSLYIAIKGYFIILGLSKFDKKEFMMFCIKVAFLFTLLGENGWSFFNKTFINFFVNGVVGFVDLIYAVLDKAFSGYGISNMLSFDGGLTDMSNNSLSFAKFFTFLDTTMDLLSSSVTHKKIWSLFFFKKNIVIGSLLIVFMYTVIFKYVNALISTVVNFISILVQTTFLLALTPIFLLFMFFETTNTYFKNWFKYMVSRAFEMIIFFLVLIFTTTLVNNQFRRVLSFEVCKSSLLGSNENNVFSIDDIIKLQGGLKMFKVIIDIIQVVIDMLFNWISFLTPVTLDIGDQSLLGFLLQILSLLILIVMFQNLNSTLTQILTKIVSFVTDPNNKDEKGGFMGMGGGVGMGDLSKKGAGFIDKMADQMGIEEGLEKLSEGISGKWEGAKGLKLSMKDPGGMLKSIISVTSKASNTALNENEGLKRAGIKAARLFTGYKTGSVYSDDDNDDSLSEDQNKNKKSKKSSSSKPSVTKRSGVNTTKGGKAAKASSGVNNVGVNGVVNNETPSNFIKDLDLKTLDPKVKKNLEPKINQAMENCGVTVNRNGKYVLEGLNGQEIPVSLAVTDNFDVMFTIQENKEMLMNANGDLMMQSSDGLLVQASNNINDENATVSAEQEKKEQEIKVLEMQKSMAKMSEQLNKMEEEKLAEKYKEDKNNKDYLSKQKELTDKKESLKTRNDKIEKRYGRLKKND